VLTQVGNASLGHEDSCRRSTYLLAWQGLTRHVTVSVSTGRFVGIEDYVCGE